MNRSTEIELVERILAMHDAGTTSMAPDVAPLPASHYTSPEHFAAEERRLFRGNPVVACLSADIPDPGDATTVASGGVPIAVVRGTDGIARAYVNICRHRASPVVRDPARGLRSLRCPFHGWTYGLDDGRLLAQPRSCDGFSHLDPRCLGLATLPVVEGRGLVVVHPGGGPMPTIDAWLGGLGEELGQRHLDTLISLRREWSTWRCNWKLLVDTFLESYHVFALHRDSLASYYLGIASPFDAYGPHNRIVVPQRSILEESGRPPAERELFPHSVVQYLIFPNLIVSNLYGYVMTWRFLPRAVDLTIVEQTLYVSAPPTTDAARQRFDERFEAARAVTNGEDFPESERVQRNLASGLVAATNPGRNEPGVVHFHRCAASLAAGGWSP